LGEKVKDNINLNGYIMSKNNGATKRKVAKKGEVIVNQENLLRWMSAISSRDQLLQRAGKSYTDDRDIYKSLGFDSVLTFKHFWEQYKRGDIAKRIIEAPVTESWRLPPKIVENDENEETLFERQWKDLEREKRIVSLLIRADKLCGIGKYSGLLLGVNDGLSLDKPISNATELLYLRPYKEDNIEIKEFVTDINDSRFGLPEMYQIQTTSDDINKARQQTTRVHWSRIIHIAEGLLENDIYGIPRLEAIFNQLKNLELVSCGSAEMFWRGALPGLAFILDKDAVLDSSLTEASMETDIEKYMHNLQRTLKLQGMDVKNLAPAVADPSNHVDVYVSLISGATGIPKRILIGSERGELASSQDETAWNKRLEDRRLNFINPIILDPFIKRLQQFGILEDVPFTIEWKPIAVPSEKEKAEISAITTKAIATYFNALDAFDFLPFEIFMREVLDYDQELIKKVLEMTKDAERTRLNEPSSETNPTGRDRNPKQDVEVE